MTGPTGAEAAPAHPELESEQRWLDQAYDHLAGMQDRARGAREASDRIVNADDSIDAKVAQYHLRRREESLLSGSGPLCFGRIAAATPPALRYNNIEAHRLQV